jgi:tRNA pseudouridine38-40 synthase
MIMSRIKCTLAYDGTGFFGYQIQPQARTVQEEVEIALKKLHKGNDIKIVGSGRTDAGVHAKGQVFHFDTDLRIPTEKWPVAINSLLTNDLSVLKAEAVDSQFHARFDAKGKEYRYFVRASTTRDPFTRHFATSYPMSLDTATMQRASQAFIGTHDFTSFCSAKTEVVDKVRTINEIDIFEENGLIVFRFVGNGFLYNMVRILTGTLLEVGSGNRGPETMSEIIDKRDRIHAGKTAPAQGLYLWKVYY